MNALPTLEFLPPAVLSVIAVVLAVWLHRAVVLDLGLLQRRRLFEGLSLLGLLVAVLIAVTTLLLWRTNPGFVVLCHVVWATFCGVLVLILLHRRRVVHDEAPLEIPGLAAGDPGAASGPRSGAAFSVPRRVHPPRRQLRENLAVYHRSAPRHDPSAAVPRAVERPSGTFRRASARQADKIRARRVRG